MKLRRSMLFVPGDNAAALSTAFIYKPDSVMFDLEDAVSTREKDSARLLVFQALRHPAYKEIETVVRVNALKTEFGFKDLEAAVRGGADIVRLPKTESAEAIHELEAHVLRIEKACGRPVGDTKVMAAIESASGVVLLTQEMMGFPNLPVSISQDRVDLIVKPDQVGDPSLISLGAARVTRDTRDLLIARRAADVIEHSGYFKEGFSMQTGSGAASTAATRFLGERMSRDGITASFALGGITGGIADLHKEGLIKMAVDVQSFDRDAAESLRTSPGHLEISANEYADPTSKGAYVDRVDVVIESALEIDLDFNVNVITGSDGVIRGASGGHCDVAAAANLTIIVAPLVRGRIPTVVRRVTTLVTPGESIDVLVTDHGIAVNPNLPEVEKRLRDARLPVMTIEELHERAVALTGEPEPLEFLERVVGIIRYRDGSVIDVVRQVKN